MLNKYRTILTQNGINTPLRQAHFMAQIEHESGLKPISENLNYSASGLMRVFPRYFPTLEVAKQYAGRPSAIANIVYANRMGNGAAASGDGWNFRGRGFIQITGRKNYTALSRDTKIDYVNNPDLLLRESDAMLSAAWFWRVNNLNRFADRDDVRGLTRAINGGLNGLDHRAQLTAKWKQLIKP